MAYHPPVFIFIMLLLWLFKSDKKEEKAEAVLVPEIEIHPLWKVNYFSNGIQLSCRHLHHYCDILQLMGNKEITDECIIDAANIRQSLIGHDNNQNSAITRYDIAAARAYLLDRWLYVTSVN
jgi:hypothetical protein